MGVITGKGTIAGAILLHRTTGAPVNGTNAVQTITFGGTPTGGTFTLSVLGFTTAPIAWSATNATLVANIDAALEALPVVGTAGVTTAVGTMTAGIGTITVTFTGNNGVQVQPTMVAVSSLTGTAPTLAVATTTPGVDATGRGAPAGALLDDLTNGIPYVNQGTATAPAWVKVSAT